MLSSAVVQGVTKVTEAREAVRSVVAELVRAYNAKNRKAIAALYHEDARYWSALGDWQDGLSEILSHIEDLHRKLPDEKMEVKALATDGESVVVEFASTGTAPSGAPYELEFTEVIELVEGKIRTVKVYLDPAEVEQIFG
jgi:uncharacterized protein (TIGR02246 family)